MLRLRSPAWLLIVHLLPLRPVNARVKTWRRLQALGAIALKNSIYVLPNTAQCREDLEWIKAEIEGMQGEATIFTADNLESFSRDEIVAAFRKAREVDYAKLAEGADVLTARLSRGAVRGRLARRPAALRDQLERLDKISFFPPRNRASAAAALARLEAAMTKRTRASSPRRPGQDTPLARAQFRRRVWVTRPRPGIDRMASAWLIRRFIDRQARFAFADKPPSDGKHLPFDMYGVEFGHTGRHCTFETLMTRFGIKDDAVNWLARIVHDVDLKDGHYDTPEAAGVEQLIAGLRATYADDDILLERGIDMFEALASSKRGT
jgi:hypothetical protein